jgi:hypothetical protein
MLALVLLLTPAASSAGPVSFAPAVRYPMPGGPVAIAAADLNGDGALDLATVRSRAGFDDMRIGTLFGDGRGRFGTATYAPAGIHAGSIVAADFNSDGHVDLAVGEYVLCLLVSDGAGGFAPPVEVSAAAHYLTEGDLNDDGHPDVVTGSSVLLGDGLGGFAPALDIPDPRACALSETSTAIVGRTSRGWCAGGGGTAISRSFLATARVRSLRAVSIERKEKPSASPCVI